MAKRVPRTKRAKRARTKLVLGEFKRGTLHSGSRKGPLVRSRSQAIAIALSQAGLSRSRGRKRG